MQLNQLLVVMDPTLKDSQPSLERASQVALQTNAAVELLVCEHHSALEDGFFTNKLAQQQARETLLATRISWMDELAKPLREQGIQVTTKARWGKPLYAEILAHIKESKPDMLFRNATSHGVLHRLLFNNTSWQLIRFCPIPLWLVRDGVWPGKNVAAALDPVHATEKPAALDQQLIAATQLLSNKLGMQAHYAHSYNLLPKSLVFEAELVVSYDSYLKHTEERHQQAFSDLLRQHNIGKEWQNLLRGAPEDTIPDFIKRKNIDLLVMGAISRGNIENALIGNTAERVLEGSDCDLLVIKPQG